MLAQQPGSPRKPWGGPSAQRLARCAAGKPGMSNLPPHTCCAFCNGWHVRRKISLKMYLERKKANPKVSTTKMPLEQSRGAFNCLKQYIDALIQLQLGGVFTDTFTDNMSVMCELAELEKYNYRDNSNEQKKRKPLKSLSFKGFLYGRGDRI